MAPNNTTASFTGRLRIKTTTEKCPLNTDDQTNQPILLYTLTALLFATCLYAMIANIVSLYKRSPKQFWIESGHRLILVCCIAANIAASTSQMCRCLSDLLSSVIITTSDSIDHLRLFAVCTAETAMVTVMLSMSTVAFQNAYVIKRFLSVYDVRLLSHKRLWWFITYFVQLLVAISFTLLGMSSHNEHTLIQLPQVLCTTVRILVYVVLPTVVAAAVMKTRKMCDQLQKEFAIRKAQQGLELRVSIKRVLERTKLLMPLFVFHVILWMVLITADIVADAAFERDDVSSNVNLKNDNDDDDDEKNCVQKIQGGQLLSDCWEVLVDTLSILYCALFPIILSKKTNTWTERLKKILTCGIIHSEENSIVPEMPVSSMGNNLSPASSNTKNQQNAFNKTDNHLKPDRREMHWQAMDDKWNMVGQQLNKK